MRAIMLGMAAATMLVASAAQGQELVRWPAPTTAAAKSHYFPIGTPIKLVTRTELNTKRNHAGEKVYLEVVEPLIYRGQVVLPVGSLAVGELARAETNGHFGKKGSLELRLRYVQSPAGPIRLTGTVARDGNGQGLLAIGGGALVAWPMFFIHGTSGKLPANTIVTAQLIDDLPFSAQAGDSGAVAVVPAATGPVTVALKR